MWSHLVGPSLSYWRIPWKPQPWDAGHGYAPPSSTTFEKPPVWSRLSMKGCFQGNEPRIRRVSTPGIGQSGRANLRRSAIAIIRPHDCFPRDRRQGSACAPDRVSSIEAHETQTHNRVVRTEHRFATGPSHTRILDYKGQCNVDQRPASWYDEGRV